MTTHSPSPECRTDDLATYRRLCGLSAEYGRIHPRAVIVVAMRADGDAFVGLAIMGERRPRRFFDVPGDISRESLHDRLDEAYGVPALLADPGPRPEPAVQATSDAEEWDW